MPTGSSPNQGPLHSTFAGDPDMGELIAEFAGEMPSRVEALESVAQAGSIDDLQRLAHQLKGAGAGYGFEPVSSAAARLENRLRALEGDERTLASVGEELRSLIETCRRVTI